MFGVSPDHQAAVIDARLHDADVVTHDEEDVGFLCGCGACASVGEKVRKIAHMAVITATTAHRGIFVSSVAPLNSDCRKLNCARRNCFYHDKQDQELRGTPKFAIGSGVGYSATSVASRCSTVSMISLASAMRNRQSHDLLDMAKSC